MATDDAIEVSLDRVREIIRASSSRAFSTADVIREYGGGFFSNRDTTACYSFNAQFGKLLKRNRRQLGIREVAANVRVTDDRGHETSASVWMQNT